MMDEGKMMDDIFESILKSTGGLQDIHTAIDSKDLAAIVKAGLLALKKALSIPMRLTERKSAEMSNQLRKEGNIHYINKDHKKAIESYNKALAYAPNGSLELKLAYSNISAVMLTIKAYQGCQLNIKAALDLDCPEFLRVKLDKREKETFKHINDEMMRDMLLRVDRDMMKYAEFNVKKNDKIPCASTDVHVDGEGKVVAARNIKSGTMVAMERAFVSVQDPYNEYTSCYFCHRMCLFFVPCDGCCKALFCTKECRDRCLAEYHRVECHIVAFMGSMYVRDVNKMAVRAAIKMSLKMTWNELRDASLLMGQSRLEKSPVSEAFDANKPASILSYDDRITVDRKRMVNASLVSASAVHCLDNVPDYLPKGKKQREQAIDSLSRIILQLNTTFLRKIAINSSAYDFISDKVACGAQRNEGWFSFASKLPNSCEPNLLVVGFNDQVGLVALQPIRKGEKLTISYLEHYYELMLPASPKGSFIRQKQIYNNLQLLCTCRVCLLEWDDKSHSVADLTDRQKTAYIEYKMAVRNFGFSEKMKGICNALDELADCPNTTQHYNLYGDLRRTMNLCQSAKFLNKTYGSVAKYYFLVDNA